MADYTLAAMHTRHLMLDHPGWITGTVISRRVVRVGTATWALTALPDNGTTQLTMACVDGDHDRGPRGDVFDPAELDGPADLTAPLCRMGTVARVANPDPWDAVAWAVIRQVIRAGHARRLYHRLCAEHGPLVDTPYGQSALLPSAETVIALSDDEYRRMGLAFKQGPLRAAAEAYLESGETWSKREPAQLLIDLQQIRRIGPWTAKATVTDLTNDYRWYDYADLAVRTWASRLAPHHVWPDDHAGFARAWEHLTGDQLAEWTALVLAWGTRDADP